MINYRAIILFIFCFSFLNYILSYNILPVNFIKNEDKLYSNEGNITFKINILDYIPSFFNITIKSTSQYNQYITYSNSDENCENERKQLAMNPYGDINLFIPTVQIHNENYFYVCVICQNEDQNCSHNTKIEGLEDLDLDLNRQYSFYISQENQITNLNLKNTQPENSILIIYIKGKYPPKTKLTIGNSLIAQKLFSNGEIYLVQYNNRNKYEDIYNLNIISEEGDYITIGSNIINDKKGKNLLVNDLEFIGYLKKGTLEEICFPLEKNEKMTDKNDIIYISGIIYTMFAKTYYKNENGEIIDFTDREITYGNILETIFNDDLKEKTYFCVSLINDEEKYDVNEVVFSIQMTSHKYINYNQLLYQPIIPGLIYPFSLSKGEIAIFSGLNSNKDTKKINFNMKAIVGFPTMHFDLCKKFPNCNYNEKNIKKLESPKHSNRMSIFNYYNKNSDKDIYPISAFQPLLIVNCLEGNLINNNGAEICVFEVSIFTEKEYIILKEGETYSQLILQGEKDLYTISYEGYKNIKKIFLDLIIFSGDVTINIDSNVEAEKYFLSNKIFYTIEIKENVSEKKINFHIKAEKNSFYMVQYQLKYEEEELKIINYLEPGLNYIESIDIDSTNSNNNYKYIKIQNLKTNQNLPFLVNFHSQNCDFKVSRQILINGKYQSQYLDILDRYGQEIIDKNDPNYIYEIYNYKIEVIKDDVSKYNKKMCMIYVSSLEYKENEFDSSNIPGQELSVIEGVPQIFNFNEKNKIIRYAFHIADKSDTILITFNLIDKTYYKIKVYIEDNVYGYNIYRNDLIILDRDDLDFSCSENQVCTIQVYIIAKEDNINARLETTFRKVHETPTYLEKNSIKQDVLIDNNYKYYYMDIGKNEKAEISIDYKRKSGNIYGQIVEKSIGDTFDEADWRGLYIFPKDNFLNYEPYLKKLIVTEDDTKYCDKGCYLLITIQSTNTERNVYENKYSVQRFSIINKVNPPNIINYSQIPIVKILINDFIVGDIPPSKYHDIYDFYELTLPIDSDEIYIDWQADLPQFCINIGHERPTKNNHHFVFNSLGHDTIFKLKKDEIIEICNKYNIALKENNSIKGLILIIGIWSDKNDSLFTSIYALRFYMPNYIVNEGELFQLEVLHIRSNHKLQCRPNSLGDILFCYFAIIFDKSDLGGHLTVYMQSQNQNDVVYYYATFVNSEQVERNNITFLAENIPDYYHSRYNYEKSKLPYIYVHEIPDSASLLISVETETDEIIELLSSIYFDDKEIYPNPSSPQLFAIKNEEIILNFLSNNAYLINIKSIMGGGKIYWKKEEEKPFYLHGENDRLSLTTGKTDTHLLLSKLVISPNEYNFLNNLPEFVFTVSFYPRNQMYNFDQIKIGSSVEFIYKDEDFPINYFSKIRHLTNITISINFYNFNFEKMSQINIENNDFIIWGKIINEEEALLARYNQIFTPKMDKKSIFGIFKYPLATLFIDEKYLDNFCEETGKEPYLYFTVEKDKFPYNLNSLNLELCVLLNQDMNADYDFAPEKVYINGQNQVTFKLRVYKNKEYMRIEFSSNSKYIDWKIFDNNELIDILNDSLNTEKKIINGRTIVTFKIPDIINTDYLILKITKEDNTDLKLSHFIFKYMSSSSKDEFLDYYVENDNLLVTKIEDNLFNMYIIKFNSISCNNCKISYIIKTISTDKYNKEEIINSIAISENEDFSLEIKDPQIDDDNTVTIDIIDNKKNILYIKVLAKINQGPINEYLLYKPYSNNIINNIIPLIYNDETKMVSHSVKYANHIEKFILKFEDNSNIPNYIKIETISKKSLNQILYFSTSDPLGIENRGQMNHDILENITYMWIKKEQFQNAINKFYIAVECRETTCDYDLNIYGQDYIEIKFNFEYSYYVGKNNKEMIFRIKNDLEKNDINSKILVFYGLGENNLSFNIKNISYINKYSLNFGTIIIFEKSENYNDDYYLEVKAKEGSFINIGIRAESKEGKIFKKMEINGPEIFGYLKKGFLEKECHLLPDFNKYENINNFYLTGIFKNKNADIYFMNQNNQIIQENYKTIDEEFIEENYIINNNYKYICIGIKSGVKTDAPYIIHLSQPNQKVGSSILYSPQIQGEIYSRIIPKGSMVYFSAMNTNLKDKNLIYHMIGTEGFPKMYIYKCKNFPNCNIDYENIEFLEDVIISNNSINFVASWKSEEILNSTIDANQYVMAIKCVNIEDSTTNDCKFKTIIYSNEDFIDLIDKLPFSKYILKNEKNNFKIDFSFEEKVNQIFIDIMIISGDVIVQLEDGNNNIISDLRKYYLGNKIYYVIDIREVNIANKIIYVNVKAEINSYFVINYQLISVIAKEKNNYLYSGINYLVSLDSKMGIKKIYTYKHKLQNNNLYLINFNSFNCKLNVAKFKKTTKISTINSIREYYSQELISNYDEDKDCYYEISLMNEDSANYDENMCMLFINHIEIAEENSNGDIQREILLNENYPYKIKFEKFKKIRYIYPHSDFSKELEIYFKNINYAKYFINIIYNNKENDIYNCSSDQFIFITHDNLEKNCVKNQLCKILIEITLLENDKSIIAEKPMIEISIRQIENVPYYLPKGIVRNDFVNGIRNLYLYTEFKKNEKGYVTVNFLRGSGKIFGKIIDKDSSPILRNDAIWQGYKFPDEMDFNLKYNSYVKKLIINSEDTNICKKSCLVLISIQSEIKGDFDDEYRIYPILIIANNNTDSKFLTKIKMHPEEYVVGSISLSNNQNNELYEYYEVTIPYNADIIQLELQSDNLELYINIGADLPTKKESDFHFDSKWKDNIFEIKKSELIQVISEKKIDYVEDNSLKKINLVIGISSNISNNIDDNIYSLRVHIPKENDININEVKGDQKVLCNPTKINNNNYRCLFVVLLRQDDYMNNLIIYARSQSQKSNINIYSDFITLDVYKNVDNQLSKIIPNEKSTYKTSLQNNNFIFFNYIEENKYIYVSVISNTPDIIEFISSLNTYDKELIPNPNSIQLFSLKNQKIIFSFIDIKNVLINIVSLAGEGKIFWEGEPEIEYPLRGRDDRLSLTSYLNNIDNSYNDKHYKLVIKNINYKENKDFSDDESNFNIINSGFVFYIEYQLRTHSINFDEIFSGKTFEFTNREAEFPLYFYSKIGEIDYDLNIFIIFHDIEIKNKNLKNLTIINSEFDLNASISNQFKIYDIKSNNNVLQSGLNLPTKGNYDSAIRVAQIYFSKEEITKFNLNKNDIPTLFLKIEKSKNSISNEYKRVSMEISVIKENSDEIITEKIYQYGKIINGLKSYKLKIDKSTEYMRIQFSSNGNNINLSINTKKGEKNNSTDINFITKIERGKLFITFKKPLNEDFIYLNIFSNNSNTNKQLNNYVFKYINADKDKFIEYPIFKNESKIQHKIKSHQEFQNITVTFKKIEKNLDIMYSVKIIPVENSLEDENMNTIAITESNSFVTQVKNPKDKNGTISLNVIFTGDEIRFIEVLAQIKDGPITEYVAYEPIYLFIKDKKFAEVIIGFSIVFLIMIATIIGSYIYVNRNYKKYKEMKDEINKISYVKSRAEEKEDKEEKIDNLLLDEKEIN